MDASTAIGNKMRRIKKKNNWKASNIRINGFKLTFGLPYGFLNEEKFLNYCKEIK